MKGVVQSITAVHQPTLSFYDQGTQRYARIVVWAKLETGERVWITTTEGELDSMKNSLKVLMFEHFFQPLVGATITIKPGDGEKTLFADQRSIPKKLRASYPEVKEQLKDWLLEVHGHRFGQAEAARQKREEAQAEINRAFWILHFKLAPNTTWAEIDALRRQEELVEQQQREQEELAEWRRRFDASLPLEFELSRDVKTGRPQWTAEIAGTIYVLNPYNRYDRREGKVLTMVMRELVPGFLYRVERLRIPDKYRTMLEAETLEV